MPLDLTHSAQKSTYEELHARPFMEVSSPARVFSVTVFFDRDDGAQYRSLSRVAERLGLPRPHPDPRCFEGHTADTSLHWSLHTEFARYTVVRRALSDQGLEPAERLDLTPLDWLEDLDGALLTASLMILAAGAEVPRAEPLCLGTLIGADLDGGAGWIESDMRLHYVQDKPLGFVVYRLGVAVMTPEQTGRVLQRIVEIDTYLCLAMMSLPIARGQIPDLDRIGIDLRALVAALGDAAQEDDGLLGELEALAADLERSIAVSQYRFAASRAHVELVEARLSDLLAPRRKGTEPLRDFVLRRLNPAMATCRAVARRQENLAERVQRATALLRARQEARHQALNRALLARTAQNGELQVRLQETVEGLSVWVLTYYVTGLAAYALQAANGLGYDFDFHVVLGFAIPLIAVVIWCALKGAKANLTSLAGNHDGLMPPGNKGAIR